MSRCTYVVFEDPPRQWGGQVCGALATRFVTSGTCTEGRCDAHAAGHRLQWTRRHERNWMWAALGLAAAGGLATYLYLTWGW